MVISFSLLADDCVLSCCVRKLGKFGIVSDFPAFFSSRAATAEWFYGTVPGQDLVKYQHGQIELCPRHLPECGEELPAPRCAGVSLHSDTVHQATSKGLGRHIQGEQHRWIVASEGNNRCEVLEWLCLSYAHKGKWGKVLQLSYLLNSLFLLQVGK